MAFVAKYRPEAIRLIGCDFSSGLSRFSGFTGRNDTFDFGSAKLEFGRLVRFMTDKGLDIPNDSWAVNVDDSDR
jgi:hypothetical protein